MVEVQTMDTADLVKLDQLSIRLKSLEIREKALSQKTEASEKWMQETLAVHIERDERPAAYLDEKLLETAISELRIHFGNAADIDVTLQDLAPKTRTYLEGKIKVPPYSYAWAQPLEPQSQKWLTPLVNIADPIFAPPKCDDFVTNLLAAVGEVLAAEEALFERLAGSQDIPPFEKPEPPKSSDYLEWQRDSRWLSIKEPPTPV
jgi:hypothetical protein